MAFLADEFEVGSEISWSEILNGSFSVDEPKLYYEHRRFAFLYHMLQTLALARIPILHNGISMLINQIAITESGCGCGVRYKAIDMSGSSVRKKRRLRRTKFKSSFTCRIGQYDYHTCLNDVIRNGWNDEKLTDKFLFNFYFTNHEFDYVYLRWSGLVSKYMVASRTLHTRYAAQHFAISPFLPEVLISIVISFLETCRLTAAHHYQPLQI